MKQVMMMTSKPLIEKIPYRKTVWIKNFAKTVTTTTLVSSGIGLIITGLTTRMQNKGYSDAELIIGVLCIIIALIIVSIIDLWAEKKKKEELEIIEKHTNEKINNLAKLVAEEKVLDYLREIEEAKIED